MNYKIQLKAQEKKESREAKAKRKVFQYFE